ncbi:MAG: helix-turn-helix domain-containing protein, partial [Ktedonobacteraceae bacterium]|nr:helix-turn-helix domain-containing protein [Ktedonobacteraceae bacterium]
MEQELQGAKGNFASLLEQLREARHISKTELARLANLTPGYISHLTLGGRTMPSEETVAALANALQLAGEERKQFFAAVGYTGEARIVTGPLVLPPVPLPEHEGARVSWGEAPDISVFYGRQRELADLEKWVLTDRCRVVTVLGLGGIGKTSLTARLVTQIKDPFGSVYWCSLKDAPRPESVLLECIQFFSNQPGDELPGAEEHQLALLLDLLLECLRTERCLLILDNFESVLQSGERAGEYRPGYEGYGRLVRLLGESGHRSCLLLTSREKPKEIALLEGRASQARSCTLQGLDETEGQELVKDRDLLGSREDWASFIRLYSGNPLALKLVSELIHEVFGGDIAAFLGEREVVFGNVQDLLDEQFRRLSTLEQGVMCWLAIEREAVSLDELYDDMQVQVKKRELLEALNSLRRRSMIEASGVALFTLQPVILEYITEVFIARIVEELRSGRPALLESHALIKAQAKDYVRNSQVRLILRPVIERLLGVMSSSELEERLKSLLINLRAEQAGDYAAGNVLNLLIELGCDLRGYDFSGLTIRQAYLQNVVLHNVDFSNATLAQSVFADTFGSILSLALSPDGSLLAVGTTNSEVRIWNIAAGIPLGTLHGHEDWVRSVVFSPNGQLLASGGDDRSVKLWDVNSWQCLKTLEGHSNWVRALAFSPDGQIVASCSDDQLVRLWDVQTGGCLRTMLGHSKRVCSIAFSPDGKRLVSGSDDQTVRLWDIETSRCLSMLQGHSDGVRAVAFSPDGKLLASASDDQTIRLWEASSGQ